MTLQLKGEKSTQAQSPSLSLSPAKSGRPRVDFHNHPVYIGIAVAGTVEHVGVQACPNADRRVVQSRDGGQFIPTFSSDAAVAGNPCPKLPAASRICTKVST